MGQYFEWVNYTKKQVLLDDIFPEGLKYTESCFVGSVLVDAVSTLLAGPWKGDLVTFNGEYIFDLSDDVTPESYPGLSRLLDVAIDPYDIDFEFEDVAGRFTYAIGKSRYVPITLANGDEDMCKMPYEGPFDLEIIHYRFIVNETRALYYDRNVTQELPTGGRLDPLPFLLGTARGALLVGGERIVSPDSSAWADGPDGLWVGDLVYPTDKRPDSYEDVSSLYTRSR